MHFNKGETPEIPPSHPLIAASIDAGSNEDLEYVPVAMHTDSIHDQVAKLSPRNKIIKKQKTRRTTHNTDKQQA